jgi:predicted RecA/RadA family phage recombinase
MATNYIQPGKVLDLLAPYDRTSGQGFQVGAIFAVALGTALSGAAIRGQVDGIWTLAKLSTDEWAVGDKVYWDNTNKRCDTDPTVGMLIGVAYATAANPTSTGQVRLNGAAPATSEGPQAAIASFTMGVNITAATANNALTDSSGTNPTEAQFNELAKEVGTKVNDILAALRAAGIIAT